MFEKFGLTRDDVFAVARTKNLVKKAFVENKEYLLAMEDTSYFFAAMSAFASSQIYGILTPQYIARKLGNLIPISTKDGLDGDFRIRNTDITVEAKTSFLSNSDSYSLVQIRLYEDIKLFFSCFVDKNYSLNMFILTKAQMEQEVDLLGSVAHVSSKYIQDNSNIEHRITLHTNDENWKRWNNTYKYETIDCVRSKFDNFIK